MAEIQNVFQRVEKKYMLETEQYLWLRKRFEEQGMQMDQYGLHTISNIYYDTDDYALIRLSLEKPVYKEKLRLRAYGTEVEDQDAAFVEIKKKFKGIVYKRRVSLPMTEAKRGLQLRHMPEGCGQIGREIDRFLYYWDPRPKALIAYDREAFFSPSEPVRLTFDHDIRFRQEDLDLTLGSAGHLLVPRDRVLMELKLPGVMPLWLCHLLAESGARAVSFSKYGTAYMQHLRPETAPGAPQDAIQERTKKICLTAS